MRSESSTGGYARISDALTGSLALRQSPVAISFSETVPDGVGAFAGRVPAGCRFWEEAASRVFATSAGDHELCAIGVYTHNLAPSTGQQADLNDALSAMKELEYVRDEDLGLIPVLRARHRYAIYSPLAATPLPPDVAILLVNASQSLILSEATSQVEHENAPAMGRPACAVVPQVVNSGRAALSAGCCGARAYLDGLNEATAIFAIPGAKLAAYTERIESLARANAILAKFHQIRRRDIEAGRAPTIKESLAAL